MALFGLPEVGVKVVAKGVDAFKRNMREVEQSQSKLTQGIINNHKKIGLAMAGVGAAIVGVGLLSVKAASDAEEMTSKFNVVFGDMADSVSNWAQETAKAMGRSRFMLMEMASSVQDTFVPMGFARDEAAEMAKSLTELAVDVASFNNKLDKDVMRDFQSALVGNTETVRKYGIVITMARVEQEILNQGWARSKGEITESMKVQARMNLIMQGTTDAQGDAIRTSDSFANRMKAMNAQMTELRVIMGQGIIPLLTPLIEKVTNLVTKIVEWGQRNPTLFKSLIAIAFAIGAVLIPLGIMITLSKTATVGLISLGKTLVVTAGKALAAAGGFLVKAIAAVWSWAGAIPFVGVAIGAAAAAAILASINSAKSKAKGLAFGGTVMGGGAVKVGERGPEMAVLPAGTNVQPINQTTFNVTENYARPEQPQSINMTLEFLKQVTR